jgi:hypothetical protein
MAGIRFPSEHRVKYGAGEWQALNDASLDVLDELEQCIGRFQRKRILALGGGPGQYSIAFAALLSLWIR